MKTGCSHQELPQAHCQVPHQPQENPTRQVSDVQAHWEGVTATKKNTFCGRDAREGAGHQAGRVSKLNYNCSTYSSACSKENSDIANIFPRTSECEKKYFAANSISETTFLKRKLSTGLEKQTLYSSDQLSVFHQTNSKGLLLNMDTIHK